MVIISGPYARCDGVGPSQELSVRHRSVETEPLLTPSSVYFLPVCYTPWDNSWGLYRDYCRDPFSHSLRRTREYICTQRCPGAPAFGSTGNITCILSFCPKGTETTRKLPFRILNLTTHPPNSAAKLQRFASAREMGSHFTLNPTCHKPHTLHPTPHN